MAPMYTYSHTVANIAKRARYKQAYDAAPKLCRNCESILLYDKRYNDFCSQRCSAIYSNTRRVRKRIPRKPAQRQIGPCAPDLLLAASFESLSLGNKKVRIMLEQGSLCAGCSLGLWLGRPLIMELDHRNGINHDDRRENLVCLCPNCHSQTDTWRGRNRQNRHRVNKVTDSELSIALKTQPNIRKALLYVGMAAMGGNYKRAQALLD